MKVRCGGFTLVELLVALLVALLIAAAAGAVLQAGFAAWSRLAVGSRTALEAARLFALLESDVASALPAPGAPFRGTADACEFRRLTPSGRNGAPSVPIRVQWGWDAATGMALRRDVAGDGQAPAQVSLLRFGPVPALRFRYAGASGAAEDPARWQDEWIAQSVTNLPSAVVVRCGAASRRLVCRLHAVPEAPGAPPPLPEAGPAPMSSALPSGRGNPEEASP